VRLVAGPPCAGKTAYVREHAELGDVILDADLIYSALTGGELYGRQPDASLWPIVWAARDGAMRELARQRFSSRSVWIVQTAAERAMRARFRATTGAEVLVLETPADVCKARASARFTDRVRLAEYCDAIDRWWAVYTPSAGEVRKGVDDEHD
jgi:hypothetical protein